jgi:fucose 4-O-acetylase-like acetyltransferase
MLFIISGYLFAMGDYKPYKQRAGKRVRTLLYPYLIWSAVGLLLTFLIELLPYGSNVVAQTHMMQLDESRSLLHQYHWYEVLARWIFFPVSYQLWFIRVLLIYNLAYPALRWCIMHRTARWVFFSFAFLLWLSTINLIFIEGEGLLFFSLGIWIQKTNFNIDTPAKWLKPKFWLIVFIGFSLLKTWLAFTTPFNGIEPVLLLMHKLVVLSGLIATWYGFNAMVKYCMEKSWFTWLSAFAFMIYVLHAPLVVYATKALLLLNNNWPAYRFAVFILLSLFLIAVSVFLGFLLRKLFPKLYSFVTGGRGLV